MRTHCILLLILFVVAIASEAQLSFDDYVAKYGKIYKNKNEYDYRSAVYKRSMRKASDLQKINPLARFGATIFSDMTEEEFRRTHLMPTSIFGNVTRSKPAKEPIATVPEQLSCSPNPTSYDWGSCGAVGPVRNQGQCGACWAFSTAETVESYCLIAGSNTPPLSVQQMLDCDNTDHACNGGLPSNAYGYIQSAGGLETESEYPYVAESQTCQFNQAEAVCTVTGYNSIDGETGLYSQISSSSGGPISVCVDASQWQNYQGGVLTSCTQNIDHCVQLTGYNGYGSTGAYWNVRNSWGTQWGENGYIWLAIGSNMCGIGNEATVPSVSVVGGSSTGSTGSTGSSGVSASTGSSTESSTGSSTGSSTESSTGSTSGSSNTGSTSTGSSTGSDSTGSSGQSSSTGSTTTSEASGWTSGEGSSSSGSTSTSSQMELEELGSPIFRAKSKYPWRRVKTTNISANYNFLIGGLSFVAIMAAILTTIYIRSTQARNSVNINV